MDGSTINSDTVAEAKSGMADQAKAALAKVNWRIVALCVAGVALAALAVFLFTPVVEAMATDPELMRYAAGFLAAVLVFGIWGKQIGHAVMATLRGIGHGIASTFRAIGRATKTFISKLTVSGMASFGFACAVFVSVIVLAYLDMRFYSSIAPPSIPPLVFMAFGLVFRTSLVAGGVKIIDIKVNHKKQWAAGVTLRNIWVFCFLCCCISALAYVVEGNDYNARAAGAITKTADITSSSVSEQIAAYNKQKDEIRKDTRETVTSLQAGIDNITKDGIDNDSQADPYRADITAAKNAERDQIAAIDALILAALQQKQTAQTTATQDSVAEPAVAAIWSAANGYTGVKSTWFRDGFSLIWVLLLEVIASFGGQAIYSLHLASKRKEAAQENGALGGKKSARRNRVKNKLQMIEDLRKEKQQTQVDADGDVEDELELDEEDEGEEPPRQAAE